MTKPIDFYFDFSSPYGYLAAQKIDEIAARHNREVTWRPHLIGTTFKTTGSQPLLNIPMKGDYARIDMLRWARLMGVGFTLPTPFPFLSVTAARAYYWLRQSNPALATDLAKAIYVESFAKGRDMSKASAVIEVAAGLGIDGTELGAAVNDPNMKALLKEEVAAATERGVFGSPFFFVDGEPFWGHDRLDDVDQWLKTGGW